MTAPKTVLSNRSVGIVELMRPSKPPMPRPIVRHIDIDPSLVEGIADAMQEHAEALEHLANALERQGLPIIARDIRKHLGYIYEDISAAHATAQLERR